jgi:hypothetical protein
MGDKESPLADLLSLAEWSLQLIDDPAAEHGRGLLLVRGLSIRTGVTGDQRGRLIWADVAFDELAAAAEQDPYEGQSARGMPH